MYNTEYRTNDKLKSSWMHVLLFENSPGKKGQKNERGGGGVNHLAEMYPYIAHDCYCTCSKVLYWSILLQLLRFIKDGKLSTYFFCENQF